MLREKPLCVPLRRFLSQVVKEGYSRGIPRSTAREGRYRGLLGDIPLLTPLATETQEGSVRVFGLLLVSNPLPPLTFEGVHIEARSYPFGFYKGFCHEEG